VEVCSVEGVESTHNTKTKKRLQLCFFKSILIYKKNKDIIYNDNI